MFLLFFLFFFNHINIHQFDSLHTGSFFLSAACSTGFGLGFGIRLSACTKEITKCTVPAKYPKSAPAKQGIGHACQVLRQSKGTTQAPSHAPRIGAYSSVQQILSGIFRGLESKYTRFH